MTCAICCNCSPMLVEGNTVFNAVALASAAVRADASVILADMVSSAACTSDAPLPSVRRFLSELRMACEAVLELKPASVNDCPGASATGCVFAPAPSSALPATEKNAGKLEELR